MYDNSLFAHTLVSLRRCCTASHPHRLATTCALPIVPSYLAPAAFWPVQAVIEVIVGFTLALGGVLLAAGELKPIRATDQMASKTLDMVNSRPEFEVFAHRGRALAQRLRNSDHSGGESKKLD